MAFAHRQTLRLDRLIVNQLDAIGVEQRLGGRQVRDLTLLAFDQGGDLNIFRPITGHAQHDQRRLQRGQTGIEGGVFRVAATEESAVLGLQGDTGVTVTVRGIALRGGLGRRLQQNWRQ